MIDIPDRIISVDADWFEKLESYLVAGERFSDNDFDTLVLFTPTAEKITFKREAA